MKFWGYRRNDGCVGVRNHVLVFPTVICASSVAQKISREVPGTICVSHQHGCGHLGEEREHMIRAMTGFCANPNVAGVLLVGLGCEMLTPEVLGEELRDAGQRVEAITSQSTEGTSDAVAKGKELAQRLLQEAEGAQREEVDASELMLGTKCGASDTLSGLTANPATGIACDLLVAEGGTAIFTETPEMLGAEHVLARRAASDEVRRRIWEITSTTEGRVKAMGLDIREAEPGPGNIEGGLTTLAEKSLGAIRKGGTTDIVQVVDYAEKPTEKGLVIMDGPAHDVVSVTGMVAAGAQVIVFTTGLGTPVGSPIAPVIKISSNSDLYRRWQGNVDLNAGAILDAEESLQSMGERVFTEIMEVASGKLTKAETLDHGEFAIHPIAPTV
ncbi:MAG: altronate dehydratase [Anaerolineae bacterium]|nr:altronate dehydratase [Anaerolineae bacterium]NIN99674.1 altronate dehydratase [Anaerolineae bacterium]NIQ82527.1 altronate dehydratase [Anaerolineae bacterium]